MEQTEEAAWRASVPEEPNRNRVKGVQKGPLDCGGWNRKVGAEWKVKRKPHLMLCVGQESWRGRCTYRIQLWAQGCQGWVYSLYIAELQAMLSTPRIVGMKVQHEAVIDKNLETTCAKPEKKGATCQGPSVLRSPTLWTNWALDWVGCLNQLLFSLW